MPTNNNRINTDFVKKFLDFISKGHNGGYFWELRCIEGDVNNRKFNTKYSKFFGDMNSLIDFVIKNHVELKDLNCYISINPRYRKNRGDSSVKFGNTLLVDLDCLKAIEDAEKIYNRLCYFGLRPSLVENSGHGIHTFWKLSDVIESDKWVELQEALISFFQKNFGEYNPDKRIKNPERITRIAGTVNVKSEPVQTSLLTESEATYSVGEIEKALNSEDKRETKILASQPEVNHSADPISKLRDLKVQEMLSKEKPEFKSLGQGTHRSTLYFGSKIYDEKSTPHDAVVTSDRKIYVDWGGDDNEIKKSFGLNYEYEFIDTIVDNTWSNQSIMEWLYGKPKTVTLKDAYDKIVYLIKIYIEFSDEMWYSFVALDILSTFFDEIFDAIGRMLIKGAPGSGKTRLCTLYKMLSFNAIMSTDWTKSSMFRAIESTKGTLIIDNFDEVPEDLSREIMVIYRAYKKGVKSVRTEGEKKRIPTGFNLLCKIVLNNISGLDEVSEDRSNILTLVKSKNEEITNRKVILEDPVWKETRDSLFICALQNWRIVKETYDTLKQKKLIGREAEIVEPILTIAKCIDETLFKQIVDFELDKIGQKKIKELTGDWVYNAMKVILEMLGAEQEQEIKLSEITDRVADKLFDFGRKDEKNKRSLAIALGKRFKNHPLFKGRMINGSAYYTFKKENVIKFCRLMDYDDLVEDVDDVGGNKTQS